MKNLQKMTTEKGGWGMFLYRNVPDYSAEEKLSSEEKVKQGFEYFKMLRSPETTKDQLFEIIENIDVDLDYYKLLFRHPNITATGIDMMLEKGKNDRSLMILQTNAVASPKIGKTTKKRILKQYPEMGIFTKEYHQERAKESKQKFLLLRFLKGIVDLEEKQAIDLIEGLSLDYQEKCDLIESERAPQKILSKYAQDESFFIRERVAKNKNTLSEDLLILAEDENKWVSGEAKKNPNYMGEGKVKPKIFIGDIKKRTEKVINEEAA